MGFPHFPPSPPSSQKRGKGEKRGKPIEFSTFPLVPTLVRLVFPISLIISPHFPMNLGWGETMTKDKCGFPYCLPYPTTLWLWGRWESFPPLWAGGRQWGITQIPKPKPKIHISNRLNLNFFQKNWGTPKNTCESKVFNEAPQILHAYPY